jgi:hypothetical protein
VAFAAILFCSTLWAALGQTGGESLAAVELTTAATIAQALDGCTPDNDGTWGPQSDAVAFTTESPWKTRILYAGLCAAAHTAVVAAAPADSPRERAPAVPSHLLHTPLLI